MSLDTLKIPEESTFNWNRRRGVNVLMLVVTGLSLALIFVPLVSILLQVVVNGVKGFSPYALSKAGGSPLSTRTGISHAIRGTIYVTVIASVLGIPLGVIVGLYLHSFGKGFWSDMLRIGIDTMVSIPTIITGVVVWALVVITMKSFSVLAGGIALAFIMVPIISKTTEEMIRLVPHTYEEAGLALGLSEAKTTMSITLPLASRGIVSGILLAFARIIGETAPLLFTAFFSQSDPRGILDASATLTVLIYNYSISPFEYWHNLAWFAALLLVAVNFIVIVVTRNVMGESYFKR